MPRSRGTAPDPGPGPSAGDRDRSPPADEEPAGPLSRTGGARRLRFAAYSLLIVAAAGVTAARIGRVQGVHGSNDRSRWLTVRALVEHQEYTIGRREHAPDGSYRDTGLIAEEEWNTIDKVFHPGRRVFVSDKMPILSTVVAPFYWVLVQLGWDLSTDERAVVVTILFLVGWLPLVLYLVLLTGVVERLGTTNWGRMSIVAAGCFGTFVPTFTTTFTNHTIAAFSCVSTVYLFVRIWFDRRTDPWRFFLAGMFAVWTFCNALPAFVFVALAALALAFRDPRKTLLWFGLGAALPFIAFAITNYLAYGNVHAWLSYSTLLNSDWTLFYEGSYWLEPQSLDQGEPSRLVYIFHYLIGHHGVLSLTPLFVFSWIGLLKWDRTLLRGALWSTVLIGTPAVAHGLLSKVAYGIAPGVAPTIVAAVALLHPWRWWDDRAQSPHVLARLTVGVSCVALGLVLTQSSNYGGHTSGPRHLLWLTPLWLVSMIWLMDRLATLRRWRAVVYVAFLVSTFSAAYPGKNPWNHPWIYDLFPS